MKKYFKILTIAYLIIISCKTIKNTPDFKNEPTSLIKTKWQLIEMNQKLFLFDSIHPTHIVFESQNKFYGYGTCNRLMGDCTFGKTQISFFNIGRTKIGCQKLMTENEIINNLKETTNYSISNNQLKFLNSNETVLLLFKSVQ